MCHENDLSRANDALYLPVELSCDYSKDISQPGIPRRDEFCLERQREASLQSPALNPWNTVPQSWVGDGEWCLQGKEQACAWALGHQDLTRQSGPPDDADAAMCTPGFLPRDKLKKWLLSSGFLV